MYLFCTDSLAGHLQNSHDWFQGSTAKSKRLIMKLTSTKSTTCKINREVNDIRSIASSTHYAVNYGWSFSVISCTSCFLKYHYLCHMFGKKCLNKNHQKRDTSLLRTPKVSQMVSRLSRFHCIIIILYNGIKVYINLTYTLSSHSTCQALHVWAATRRSFGSKNDRTWSANFGGNTHTCTQETS